MRELHVGHIHKHATIDIYLGKFDTFGPPNIAVYNFEENLTICFWMFICTMFSATGWNLISLLKHRSGAQYNQ